MFFQGFHGYMQEVNFDVKPTLGELREKLPQYLVRHINGDTLDNSITNLQWVVFSDIFDYPEWTIDYAIYLTEEETEVIDRARARYQK